MSDSPPTLGSSSPPPAPRRQLHGRQASQHAPLARSRLRESLTQSPVDEMARLPSQNAERERQYSHISSPPLQPQGDEASAGAGGDLTENDALVQGQIIEPSQGESNARTRLLEDYYRGAACGSRNCNHGTFSPRPESHHNSICSGPDPDGRYGGGIGENVGTANQSSRLLGDSFADTIFGGSRRDKRMSTTQWLALKHGIKNRRLLYVSYYFPFMNWIRQYQWRWFRGDLVAALTMASFYIPMSLSFASNLGHVPPINGLYSFVFNPIIYAFLGTCPQMVVGPEAAGSLLVGQVVRTSVDTGNSGESNDVMNAQIAGVVTGMAGAIIFVAGLTRLGFLDSILSRPFLRGFISAIGFVILVDQLIPELGLAHFALHAQIDHGSSATKIAFLFRHVQDAHALTAAVSITGFVIIMIFRTLKRRLQPRFPSVAYFPDRFLVVALSAVFAWTFEWDEKGVEVLGSIKSSGSYAIPFHWPFQFQHMKHIDTALGTSFIIALLGFFESSVAAKSLGEGTSDLQGMTLSANRELIALGAANIVGGCFMALPAFGGYGRSKVNASTGGRTPMSSILLSAITLVCVLFLLPSFYYLPKGVLSAMISVVAYSLIEECPHDIKFFFKIRGWTELSLMTIIFLATVFYSLSLGIALGIGLSTLAVIRHATKPRIQILGRVPGTTDKFENAELMPEVLEFIEGCLIVKIPEPLTFANTGELRTRLRRLEHYGTNAAHPALPRVRPEEHNRNIIFDVHGVTGIDGSGTQVLTEIVESYVNRGVRIFFCRLPHERGNVYRNFELAGIVELCGGTRRFVANVEEALKLAEIEDLEEYFDNRMDGSSRNHTRV